MYKKIIVGGLLVAQTSAVFPILSRLIPALLRKTPVGQMCLERFGVTAPKVPSEMERMLQCNRMVYEDAMKSFETTGDTQLLKDWGAFYFHRKNRVAFESLSEASQKSIKPELERLERQIVEAFQSAHSKFLFKAAYNKSSDSMSVKAVENADRQMKEYVAHALKTQNEIENLLRNQK